MNILNLRIISNAEIDPNLLKDIAMFDRKIFPVEGEYSFPDDYLEKLYEKNKEGLFVLLDKNDIVGYVNCIFLSDEIKKEYLRTKDYLILENEGFQIGDNNMYFYTLALDEKYRNSSAVKMLMQRFCAWINQEKRKGKNISSCISEAITEDGIRTLLLMGMIPKDVDENGLGIYYSPDCLNSYINGMFEKKIEDEER